MSSSSDTAAVTLVTWLWRRLGMSREDFVARYEGHHARIGERVLSGYATRYVRRYLQLADGGGEGSAPDVMMEITFPNEATRAACFAAMADPAIAAEIAADEECLFDREKMRVFLVEEHASVLPPVRR